MNAMNASTPTGELNVSIEAIHLVLSTADAIPSSASLRADVECVGDVIKWSGHSGSLLRSPHIALSIIDSIVSVNMNLKGHTEAFDLSKQTLSTLCNSSMRITISSVTSSSASKSKGQEPSSSLDPLLEIIIPLRSIILAKDCRIDSNSAFDTYDSSLFSLRLPRGYLFDSSQSRLHWTVGADDHLAEHALGCSTFRFTNANMHSLPYDLAIQIPEVVDPKMKGPPSDATRQVNRGKTIEAIGKAATVSAAAYSISVGVPEISDTAYLNYLSHHHLACSHVAFDTAAAASVPQSEDLRHCPHIWSLDFAPSKWTFFHRSELKRLAFALFSGPVTMPVKLVRISSSNTDVGAVYGGELNLSAFSAPGTLSSITAVNLSTLAHLEDSAVRSAVLVNLHSEFSSSPTPPPPQLPPHATPHSLAEVLSTKQASENRDAPDVMQELRDEISSIISTIAREYVTLYPLPPSESTSESIDMATRRKDFLHYLASTSKYHALKESLKPKIQRAVRFRYGVRGRCLHAGESSAVPPEGVVGVAGVPLDALLQEVYVFLLRECNVVLNSVYLSTVIAKDAMDIEQGALIDDEKETSVQRMSRLADNATDAEADLKYDRSEQSHLERIQMVSSEAEVGLEPENVFAAYALYAEFLLRRAAKLMIVGALDDANRLRAIAREALETAASRSGRRRFWRYELLLASLLLECGLFEAGAEAMNRAMSSQLGGHTEGPTTCIEELSGYDSEGLVDVDPSLYAILAAHFRRSNEPLKTRKTLRLMSASYAHGKFSPEVSSHGVPRRTAVLCLARAAEYLFGFGLHELGSSCLELARECNSAAEAKAREHNVSTNSVPFIRYALQRAEAAGLLSSGRVDESVEAMQSSVLMADTMEDKARSLVWMGNAVTDFPQDDQCAGNAIDTYLKTIQLAATKLYIIPLESYIRLGKLLVDAKRYEEARQILLYGCRLYPSSATLFKLMGIVSLRLNNFDDAENALYEANLLDNRNPEIWGVLAILCLKVGVHRFTEAEKAIQQSIRLGINDTELLRELVIMNFEINKLQLAEEIALRLIVIEKHYQGRVNPLTHMALGDIFKGRGKTAEAIREYRAVMENDDVEDKFRESASAICEELLWQSGQLSFDTMGSSSLGD